MRASEPVSGPMADPAHPGDLVRHDCIAPLGLSVTAAAKALGVSRKTLDNLVNRRAGVSPEMAVRLATAFGGSAQAWINMQSAYDLAQVRKREAEIRATVTPQAMHEPDPSGAAPALPQLLGCG